MRRVFLVLLVAILFVNVSVFSKEEKLTVLFTGETHSYLYPCDCPLNPDGGLSRRSTLIRTIKEKQAATLALDAGGAFAGGKYDEKTQGVSADKSRTGFNLKAMEIMGYYVISLGDEEFAFGLDYLTEKMLSSKIAFISDNIYRPSGELFARPYVIKQFGDIRVGIIGVSTQEMLTGEFREALSGLRITDPVVATGKVLGTLRARTDLIIVLSHLGEELSKELIKNISGIDLLINAHRKISSRPFDRINDTVFAQFSFQGKSVGRVDFVFDEKRSLVDTRVKEIKLKQNIKNDPQIDSLLSEYEASVEKLEKKVQLDLYVMSDCPYGKEAETVLFPLAEELGKMVDLNLYYLVNKEGDSFTSLHGHSEVMEDRRQLAVANLYPDKLSAYIALYNHGVSGENVLRELGLEVSADEINSEKITAQLNEHAERSRRLRISSSPTLYINNVLYQGGFGALELRKYLCGLLPPAARSASRTCQKIPECLTNADCAGEKGKIGRCVDAGQLNAECEYQDAIVFNCQVVIADDCLMCNQFDIITTTEQLFPGVQLSIVEKDSPEGRALIEKYTLKLLPAYLFSPQVRKAYNYNEVKEGFIPLGDMLALEPGLVGASYFVNRNIKGNQLDIFVAALGLRGRKIVRDIIEYLEENPTSVKVNFHITGFIDEKNEVSARLGLREEEEARRMLVLKKLFPAKFLTYLKISRVESSYWQDALIALKLEPQKIRALAEGELGHQLFRKEAELSTSLGINEELAFLINNRELAQIKSLDTFRALLQKLSTK